MGLYASGKVLSLLTPIRNGYKDYELNIISGLSMIFHKVIRAYCFIPNPLVSSAPRTAPYCSRTRKLRRLSQGGVDLYWALAANVLRGMGRLCTKGGSRTRKNCVRTECLDCESSRKEQSPALVYAIDGTRA